MIVKNIRNVRRLEEYRRRPDEEGREFWTQGDAGQLVPKKQLFGLVHGVGEVEP